MADADAEVQIVDPKQAPAGTRDVYFILRRVDLHLVLIAKQPPVRRDDHRRGYGAAGRRPFHADDGANAHTGSGFTDGSFSARKKGVIRGRHVKFDAS
jgi:hypothetical protein